MSDRGIKSWNPLFCSPSPRDIPEVFACHQKLRPQYDFLYAKYFVEREAYGRMREFFLKHEEYTHMILVPDDLIFTPDDVEKLRVDLFEQDYPILAGICNVDLDINKDKWAITENLPHPYRPLIKIEDPEHKRWWGYRWYAWYDDTLIEADQKRQKSTIIRVMHSGFALQAMRRDVVDMISFITDAEMNGIEYGETSSIDVMFSNSCAIGNVAIRVDPRIRMLHMRHSGAVDITLGNGELWHFKDGKKYTYKPTTPSAIEIG